MRRTLAIISATLLVLTTAALASNQSVSFPEDARSCADLHVTYDYAPAAIAQESLTIPGSVALNVDPGHNGGVHVIGYDGSQFQVATCKAARTQAELDSVHPQFTGDQLTATGDRSSVVVYFLIQAPRSASIAVKTHNGPVSIADVSGHVQVSTENGPIKLRKTSGDVLANAQNGPIDFTGDSGKVELHATNGPVKLALDGTHWNGSGVEASSENGPLSLYLARDYNSGVVVRTDGHSPMSCERSLCRNAGDFDEGERRVELGNGQTVINLSTHNGPVKIATRREVL
jgi:hypothetical protein